MFAFETADASLAEPAFIFPVSYWNDMNIVIVESPAKARTIQRFLDSKDFDIQASFGHVRDLPESADEIPDEIRKKKWGRLGVDTDNDFKPYYVVPNDKRKHVAALKAALERSPAT